MKNNCDRYLTLSESPLRFFILLPLNPRLLKLNSSVVNNFGEIEKITTLVFLKISFLKKQSQMNKSIYTNNSEGSSITETFICPRNKIKLQNEQIL